jgi:hypothetical protein
MPCKILAAAFIYEQIDARKRKHLQAILKNKEADKHDRGGEDWVPGKSG